MKDSKGRIIVDDLMHGHCGYRKLGCMKSVQVIGEYHDDAFIQLCGYCREHSIIMKKRARNYKELDDEDEEALVYKIMYS